MDDDWYTITFSVELIRAALTQIRFLKDIDRIGHLYEGYYFNRALYRYEHIWLPLLAELDDDEDELVAPIDIQWVWYVHMLYPAEYKRDVESICGRLIDHRLSPSAGVERTRELWERYTNNTVPYNYLEDFSEMKSLDETKIKFDLADASVKQKFFIYQVSLPHFENYAYLNKGVERYKKYLYMRKMYVEDFLVPCYLVDLMWYTHKLHPVAYSNDFMRILGRYDGDVSTSTTDERTRDVWRHLYNEDCFQAGAMFRGYPIDFTTLSTKTLDLKSYFQCFGIFTIESVQLKAQSLFNDDKIKFKEFRVNIYRMLNKTKDELLSQKLKSNTKFVCKTKTAHKFIDHLPEMMLLAINIEETKTNKNRLQYVFATEISLVKDHILNPQSHEFEFYDAKNSTKYTLLLTMRVFPQIKKRIAFFLQRKRFTRINLPAAMTLLESLQTPLAALLSEKSCVLRARHRISIGRHGGVYDLDVLNIDNPQFSALKVFYGEHCVALAKTIGLEQLPTDKFDKCINLNIKNERAMLIQHAYGDYAIIKAQYVYTSQQQQQQSGDKATTKTRRHLRIHFHSLLTKTTYLYDLRERYVLSILNPEKTIKAVIDLKTGFISFDFAKKVHHFEAFLASLFAIVYLYVFLFQNFSVN